MDHVGALIIRLGSWGPLLYHVYYEEPLKIISIGFISRPCVTMHDAMGPPGIPQNQPEVSAQQNSRGVVTYMLPGTLSQRVQVTV